jgi:hypothetical protein
MCPPFKVNANIISNLPDLGLLLLLEPVTKPLTLERAPAAAMKALTKPLQSGTAKNAKRFSA